MCCQRSCLTIKHDLVDHTFRREHAGDLGVELGLYLVFGRGFPDGDAVYVMRDTRRHSRRHQDCKVEVSANGQDAFTQTHTTAFNTESTFFFLRTQDVVFYCPKSGEAFSAADPNCPLTAVHCLVTPNNMFANIQQTATPSEMVFDIHVRASWKPLFERNSFDPTVKHEQYDRVQNAILR